MGAKISPGGCPPFLNVRTSWGSPSLENFNCSTPPHLAAALLAKLSMEMGTGLRFGKKKLSNRDSPCRRQSWAGRQVLGVKRAGLASCKHKAIPPSVCQSHPEPDSPPEKPTTSLRARGHLRHPGLSVGIDPGTVFTPGSFTLDTPQS